MSQISKHEEQKLQTKKNELEIKKKEDMESKANKLNGNIEQFLKLFKQDKVSNKEGKKKVNEREYLVNCFYDVLTEGFIALDESQPADPYTFLVSITRRISCMRRVS